MIKRTVSCPSLRKRRDSESPVWHVSTHLGPGLRTTAGTRGRLVGPGRHLPRLLLAARQSVPGRVRRPSSAGRGWSAAGRRLSRCRWLLWWSWLTLRLLLSRQCASDRSSTHEERPASPRCPPAPVDLRPAHTPHTTPGSRSRSFGRRVAFSCDGNPLLSPSVRYAQDGTRPARQV